MLAAWSVTLVTAGLALIFILAIERTVKGARLWKRFGDRAALAFPLVHLVRDMAWVAAAGPVSNLLLAFLGLVAWVLVSRTITSPFVAEPLQGMLRYVYLFNLGLAIFNLIPLPPLDGGHFLPYLLPRRSWSLLAPLERWGPLLLILLILSGATRHVLGPALVLLSGAYLALVRWLL